MAPRKRKRMIVHSQTIARLPCPACQKDIPSFFINSHLDLECPALKQELLPCRPQAYDGLGSSVSAVPDSGGCPSSVVVQAQAGVFQSDSDTDQSLCDGMLEHGEYGGHCEEEEKEEGNVLGTWAHNIQLSRETPLMLSLTKHGGRGGARNCREGYGSEKTNSQSTRIVSQTSTQSVLQRKVCGGALGLNKSSVWMHSAGSLAANTHNLIPSQLKLNAPKGLHVHENFITAEEEEHLLRCLDMDVNNPWKPSRVNGIHAGKSYGNHIFGSLSRRVVTQVSTPMPTFVLPIVERMRDQVALLKDFFPNEMNSIDYRKSEGHYLKAHMDDRQLSGTILVNLSLGGCCFMTYTRERGLKEAFRVMLLPRSLQIVTGQSRYNYTHGIQKGDIVDPRRVSMTFRQSAETSQIGRPSR